MTTDAEASPLCPTAATLADYENFGGIGCTVEDKLFREFGYSASGNAAVPASQILVTINGAPGDPGLNFFANWQVTAGQSLDSTINFQVLAGGPVIQGASIQLVGAAGGDATVAVTEQILGLLDRQSADPNFADVSGFSAVSGIAASYDIALSAPSGSLAAAQISEMHTAFAEEPGCTDGGCPPPPGCTDGGCGPVFGVSEPATWVLLATGCLCYVVRRQRAIRSAG